jgi:hypothetical protein
MKSWELLACWQIQQLVLEFYASLDEKRYDDLVALFSEGGSWNRLGEPLVGPEAIRAALATREDWLTAHVVSNVRVKLIDSNNAESAQYVTLYRLEGVEPGSGPGPIVPPMGILSHRDRHVRANGSWKIAGKNSRAMFVNRTRVTHYDKPAGA